MVLLNHLSINRVHVDHNRGYRLVETVERESCVVVGGWKMPVLGYEMTSQELCPMYNAAEFMVGAQAQWDKPTSPYYRPVVRSPPQESRAVMTYNEGLLTLEFCSHVFICTQAILYRSDDYSLVYNKLYCVTSSKCAIIIDIIHIW